MEGSHLQPRTKKQKVTEEDLIITKALIGQSFSRVKAAVSNAPSELVRPATTVVREHPLATTAAAAGAGVILFQVMRLLIPRVVVKEVEHGAGGKVREKAVQPDLTSQVISIAMPYVIGIIQQELGKMMRAEARAPAAQYYVNKK